MKFALAAVAAASILALASCPRDTRAMGVEDLKREVSQDSAEIDRIIKLKVRDWKFWKEIGSLYLEQGMFGEAREAYLKVLEATPASPNILYYLGLCASYMAKDIVAEDGESVAKRARLMREAEKYYLRCLEVDGGFSRAQYALAVLYVFELNRPPEAKPLLLSYLETQTEDPGAYALLARVYYTEGSLEKAAELYDKVISLSPSPQAKAEAEASKKRILDELYGAGSPP